ncbi:MAG: polysaccharide deacetylase [Acidobacteria bacterium]|nr:polysaccharide deacetylase [Acidobacteriota bacterium]
MKSIGSKGRTALGVLAGAMFVGALALVVEAQAQQPAAEGPAAFPGIRWSEDQLKQAVAPARAGRVLTPKSWPNGAKVAVCVSFDIDNESPALARGNTNRDLSAMSDTEYGATEGLPRILRILDQRGIPASFYIPAVSNILAPGMLQAIQKSGRHEIALHGWIHESVASLNDAAEEERLLKQAIDYFTKLTGKKPVGSRTGGWAISPYTLDIEKRLGMVYDSSMMAMDQPYEIVAHGKNTGLIELPVTWVQDDAPYFGRTGALPSPELIFNVYRDEFDMAYEEGGMLMLTMHPHVSGRRSRAVHLAKLLDYMKAKPGVWFATAEQIANYVQKEAARSN